MPTMTVDQGDSISSIAKDNGHFWKTIWEHGQNSGLRSKRKDPNVLFPGDEVFVPDIELKEENRGVNQRHKFKLKGEECKFKMKLLMMGEPRANESYILNLDGKLIKGTTDGDGMIEQVVPADAQSGKLILGDGKEEYEIRIGHLNPIDEISGVQQRLNNLGFSAGAEDGELSDDLAAALTAFQNRYHLPANGQLDSATKSKLEQLHP